MIRLLYISDAKEGITEETVDSILQNAARNNPPLDITGVLIYAGNVWAQVLEGPAQNVMKKYLAIAKDARHSNCRLVLISTVTDRVFKDWSMAALEALPLELEHIAELDAYRKESVPADTFISLVNHFLARLTPIP